MSLQVLQSSYPGSINGPVATNPSASHVLICLHGFGSSGDDLIALAPGLQTILGNLSESINLAVYAPHGPALTPGDRGHQWFRDMGWTFRDEPGLKAITPQLDSFIASVATHHNIPTSNIAVLGFSQGAMTLLHALPSLTHQPAGLISCCGALTVNPTFPPTPNPVPLLFLHGEDDDVLPADTSVKAAEVYRAHGYPTEVNILENLGHGINAACLAHIAVFLQTLWSPQPL